MKKQGQYDDLIEEFQKKQELRDATFKMTRIEPKTATKRFFSPVDARLVRVSYLGWGRNAWHSTWINQYHPGTIDCDLSRLQKLAENERTPGSQLWIETRDALWLRLKRTNALMVQINGASTNDYNHLLKYVDEGSLKKFWEHTSYIKDDWLLFFELGKWCPDSVSRKEAQIFHAFNQGSGKSLGWTSKPHSLCTNFLKFAKDLVKKSLGPDAVKNLEKPVKAKKRR